MVRSQRRVCHSLLLSEQGAKQVISTVRKRGMPVYQQLAYGGVALRVLEWLVLTVFASWAAGVTAVSEVAEEYVWVIGQSSSLSAAVAQLHIDATVVVVAEVAETEWLCVMKMKKLRMKGAEEMICELVVVVVMKLMKLRLLDGRHLGKDCTGALGPTL